MSRRTLLAVTAATEGALAAVAVLALWLSGVRLVWGVSAPGLGTGALVGAVMAAGVVLLSGSGNPFFCRLRADFDRFVGLFARCSVIELAMMSVYAGVAEELLFRGFLQGWIAGLWGLHAGVIVAAVIFGILHAISPVYAVFVIVLGLLLGYLYQFSGSLTGTMLAHAVYDFAVLFWAVRMAGREHETE